MKNSIISDKDGVLYRGGRLVDGVQSFVDGMLERNIRLLFLTNNAKQTPLDLERKLEGLGVRGVSEEHFITSAMATALFR